MWWTHRMVKWLGHMMIWHYGWCKVRWAGVHPYSGSNARKFYYSIRRTASLLQKIKKCDVRKSFRLWQLFQRGGQQCKSTPLHSRCKGSGCSFCIITLLVNLQTPPTMIKKKNLTCVYYLKQVSCYYSEMIRFVCFSDTWYFPNTSS